MYLGVDLGTSGVKTLLIDGDQKVVASASGSPARQHRQLVSLPTVELACSSTPAQLPVCCEDVCVLASRCSPARQQLASSLAHQQLASSSLANASSPAARDEHARQ